MLRSEHKRFEQVSMFRVDAVEDNYFRKPEPLYRKPQPWEVKPGFAYSNASRPEGKFPTVEAALAAVRQKLGS